MAHTVSDVVWTTLHRLGADCVFGVPGSQTTGLFQALRASGLRTIVPTHELAASFMANGYARATGRPGILCTIPGPGFTYALTGLAEARLDSTPLVFIVPAARECRTREHLLQAIDQRAMAAPLVKQIVRLNRAGETVTAVTEAYRAATAGEPGPVMLEIESEVLKSTATTRSVRTAPTNIAFDADIDALVDRINGALKILLYLGGGANAAAESVRAIVSRLNAAVIATTSGRGIVPDDHQAMIARDTGVGCTRVINRLVSHADLVLALGCKFSHNGAAGFSLAIDPARLATVNSSGPSRNYPASLHLTADVGHVLARILPRLSHRDSVAGSWDRTTLAALRQQFDDRDVPPEPHLSGTKIGVASVIRDLALALPSDTIVVTDSGLHQMCVRRHFTVRAARGLMVPVDFQSMGFALPAAIGAALAAPTRRVVAIVGDGGLMMSALELATAVREQIDVTVIVFNDAAYGLIRQEQLADFGTAHGSELVNPDFEALAGALGAEYRSCLPDGIAAALMRGPGQRHGVRLIEVPLQDAPAMRRIRALGTARRMARLMVPSAGRGAIRRWLRR